MRRRIPAALALALFAACSPSTSADPSPSAAPTPTQTATPDPSTDPLYLEAVEVYKAYFAEMGKSEVAGYPEPTLPARYDKYLTGQMKEVVGDAWINSHESGLRISEPAKLVSVEHITGARHGDSLVGLRTCSNGTHARILNKQGRDEGPGIVIARNIFFVREDGRLKGSYNEAQKVTSCAKK